MRRHIKVGLYKHRSSRPITVIGRIKRWVFSCCLKYPSALIFRKCFGRPSIISLSVKARYIVNIAWRPLNPTGINVWVFVWISIYQKRKTSGYFDMLVVNVWEKRRWINDWKIKSVDEYDGVHTVSPTHTRSLLFTLTYITT